MTRPGTHVAIVPVADLISWACKIDDEIDLDGVSAALRGAANDPDADLVAAVQRARAEGACTTGRPPLRCSYHEGWHDALDFVEDESGL
jgi:hypothetical protein